jgi:hypothetical protein
LDPPVQSLTSSPFHLAQFGKGLAHHLRRLIKPRPHKLPQLAIQLIHHLTPSHAGMIPNPPLATTPKEVPMLRDGYNRGRAQEEGLRVCSKTRFKIDWVQMVFVALNIYFASRAAVAGCGEMVFLHAFTAGFLLALLIILPLFKS